MINIYIPVCGLFFSILLLIIFLAKKSIKTIETKLFSYLIFSNTLNSILTVVIIYFGYITPQFTLLFKILNRIDFCTYIIWISSFFLYIFHITFIKNEKMYSKYNIIKKIIIYFDAIVYLLTITLPFYIFNDGYMYSYGPAVTVLYISIGIYVLLTLITIITNYRLLINKKYIPLYALIIIIVFTMVIRSINPGLLLISSAVTYVNLIMFFTIENPDIKLLEEVHQAKEISDNANEEKTLFLYNMTQEIRNTTSKINNDADIILDSKDWNETYDSARNIKAETSSFTTMTNDILDVSKIDSSTIKIYNSKYEIDTILKEIICIYNNTCKNKGLEFRNNIDRSIPKILYGDSIELKQVLTNVLNNSVMSTERGYIELDLNAIIKNDICRLIITIEDSSTGIKSEELNEVMINNKNLAGAYKLITIMNGTMLISSNYGKNTRVKIILDQKIEEIVSENVKKYDTLYDNKKILLVNSSEAGNKIVEKLLKNSNIELSICKSGKECIDKIRSKEKYDLILLDENQESLTKEEIVKKLNSITNFNTKIILLTKDNSYEYNDELKESGFDDYLLKPLTKDNFLSKIDKYLKKDN